MTSSLLGTATVTRAGASASITGPSVEGRNRRHATLKFNFGNSSDYYQGGVVLPAKLNTFNDYIDVVNLFDQNDDGVMYKYDRVNNLIRAFHTVGSTALTTLAVSGVEFTSADKPTATTLYADAWGW